MTKECLKWAKMPKVPKVVRGMLPLTNMVRKRR